MEFYQRNQDAPTLARTTQGGGQGAGAAGHARAEGLRMAEHGLDAVERALSLDPTVYLRTTAQDSAE